MSVVEPSEKTLERVKSELESCLDNTRLTGYIIKDFVLTNTLLQLTDHELGPNAELIRSGNIIIKARTDHEAAVCFLGVVIDLQISKIIETINGYMNKTSGYNIPSYLIKFVDLKQNINEFTLNNVYNKLYPQEYLLEKLHQLLFTANNVEFENIIKSGKVDINKPLKDGSYLLEAAIQKDSKYNTFINILLENGAKVNIINTNEKLANLPWLVNPLCLAITNRRQDIVELLLKHGADVNFPITSNERYPCYTTALHTAATFSHARKEISFVRELIQENGWPEMVEKLLLLGANPWFLDDDGRMAIEFSRNNECIKLLTKAIDIIPSPYS